MGGELAWNVGHVLAQQQLSLARGTIHFSYSKKGVMTSMSFCRALNTRQRAVSSEISRTSAISRNDRSCSTRSKKAAQNRSAAGPPPVPAAARPPGSWPARPARRAWPPAPPETPAARAGSRGARWPAHYGRCETATPENSNRSGTNRRRENAQEAFLNHVLGLVHVVCQVIKPAEQAVPVSFHQGGKSAPVPELGTLDQHMLIF